MECTFFLKRFFIGLILLGKNCPYSEFSGPFFPAFGLNAEIYSVNLQVQYEYGKIRTRKNFVSMKKIDSLKKLDQVLIIRCKNHALQIKTLLTPGQMWQPVVVWKHFVISGILSKKKIPCSFRDGKNIYLHISIRLDLFTKWCVDANVLLKCGCYQNVTNM